MGREHNNTTLGEELLQELDKGIEDMESGGELPIEEAFDKITDLRKSKRDETK